MYIQSQQTHFKKAQLPDFEMTLEGTLRFRLIRSVLYSRSTRYVFVSC
jgi:hypothetical protein